MGEDEIWGKGRLSLNIFLVGFQSPLLEIPEQEGARRSEVGKRVLDAFKG